MTRPRVLLLLTLVLAASGLPRSARANLVLSLSSPSYSISALGGTTTVSVYLSQVAGTLPNITASNPLYTGGIELTFATAGAAIETGFTPSLAWDSSSAGSSLVGANTVESLTLLSLAGISNLSQSLLLGSFTFTGESVGMTTVTLSTIQPGVNFIDKNGDDLDPTSTPSSTITVGPASVPEPGSLAMSILGGVCVLARLAAPRRRSA